MERDTSNDRTSLRARPVDADATVQVPTSVRAMKEALMALEHGEIEEDVLTRLGPVDPDATFIRHEGITQSRGRLAAAKPAEDWEDWEDVVLDELVSLSATEDEDNPTERVSFSMPIHPSMGATLRKSVGVVPAAPHRASSRAIQIPSVSIILAAPPPSAHVRAEEARARRDRLSASFTQTPSGKMTLRPPPIDLSADQTVDPVERVTRPTRTVESFAPKRVAFPQATYAAPNGPLPLFTSAAPTSQLALDPGLRDTARRPLAPPILTQVPAYLRSNAPSSIMPVALATSPGSTPRAVGASSRAQNLLMAAMLFVGIGSTAVMGTATFAPGTLAKGRAVATVQLDTLLGHPPRTSSEAPPAPTYVEALPPVVTGVPPVLADTAGVAVAMDARDGGS